MKLTMQEVHTYNNLVKEGKAQPLGDFDQMIIPRLVDNDEVVLYDLSSGTIIRPGINLIEKIKSTIDRALT